MEEEIWKRVIRNGQITNYEVSIEGDVRRYDTKKHLKSNKNPKGYPQLRINGKTVSVHRLVAEAFIPNPDNLPQVNHINGDKTDNRVENLEWCDNSRNQIHAFRLGLNVPLRGERNPFNKYKEETIIKACELLQSGEYTRREVSIITNISLDTIYNLAAKGGWTDIVNNYDFSNIKHGKGKNRKYYNAIDRAILSGAKKKHIVKALINHGLPKKNAESLYKMRKRAIRKGKSIDQCTVYIDEGEEIF